MPSDDAAESPTEDEEGEEDEEDEDINDDWDANKDPEDFDIDFLADLEGLYLRPKSAMNWPYILKLKT